MKILYLAPASNPHSIRWIKNLDTYGNHVCINITWITFEPPPVKSQLDNTSILIDYIHLPRDLSRLFLISRVYDFCHVHSLARYIFPLLFINTKRIKLIMTAWGSDIYVARKNWIVRTIQNLLLPRADFLTGDSKEMCSALGNISKKESVHRINFGTDCKSYSPNAVFHNIPGYSVTPGKYILSTRNFFPVYDIITAIKAYAKLSDAERLEYPLVLVGKGPEKDRLHCEIDELGIKNNVIFTGYLPYDHLPGLYANCRAYISTSLSDAGLAASTAEAMSCGAISIVSNVKENSDWVSTTLNTGFLFEPRDLNSLFVHIKNVIHFSERDRQATSDEARKLILKNSNAEIESKKFLKLVHDDFVS